MASRTVYFSAFTANGGYLLSGLSLSFATTPGYYRINGVPVTAPPTITEVGTTGTYAFTAELQEGEQLAWRVALGAQASSRYVFGDLVYADCIVPSTGDALQIVQNDLDATRLAAELSIKLLKNKIVWDVNTAVMTVYDDNGSSPLYRFAFTDENGVPSVSGPLNRRPL